MSHEMLPSEWESRDRPVLVAAARLSRDQEFGISDLLAAEMQLSEREVVEALFALEDAGYLRCIAAEPRGGFASVPRVRLLERGRRELGIWPSGDAADALVDALRQAEENTDDPEEKSLLRRAAGAVGSVSREVMTDVLAAVVRQQMGV